MMRPPVDTTLHTFKMSLHPPPRPHALHLGPLHHHLSSLGPPPPPHAFPLGPPHHRLSPPFFPPGSTASPFFQLGKNTRLGGATVCKLHAVPNTATSPNSANACSKIEVDNSASSRLNVCTDRPRFARAGGDTFLQICLWEAGHAITSPGAGFYDWQMRSFDAGSEDRMGLVDYIMRAIEGTCHDRGLCNVSL